MTRINFTEEGMTMEKVDCAEEKEIRQGMMKAFNKLVKYVENLLNPDEEK